MALSEASKEPPKSTRADKGYLASAVDSLNPWASSSRSSSPAPPGSRNEPMLTAHGDHSTTHLYGQSIRTYPSDCPPLRVLWFHATDTPKRKPAHQRATKSDEKQLPVPKKFVAFSQPDSSSIETAYQKLLEEAERRQYKISPAVLQNPPANLEGSIDTSTSSKGIENGPTSRVPVNEDYLFDVDIEKRELEPVYWLGPVFEVRRGTWFYQEGSTLRPCEENLASQLEEGFLRVKPWLYPTTPKPDGPKDLDPETQSMATDTQDNAATDGHRLTTKAPTPSATVAPEVLTPSHQPKSQRLFGTYMNSVVTYQDAATAWLSSDSMLSWVTSTVYQRFAGGGYMSGIKLVRGWSTMTAKNNEGKNFEDTGPNTPTEASLLQQDERQKRMLKRRSAPPTTGSAEPVSSSIRAAETPITPNAGVQLDLPDVMKSDRESRFNEDEAFRKRAEKEIRNDYVEQSGDSQGRDIEHLVLVTHGIGQMLSMRMESLNFVHDVNVMRKTMKSTYSNSADLCALNTEPADGAKNCRVQVLPVCWRHLLDFPQQREKKTERDIGDLTTDEDEYPSLEDITIEGVTFARSLVSDLALDVLLYQSAYRERISEIVLKEANRIYGLFMDRNPQFKGKVHVIGHSLGSAIMFDILCRQKESTRSPEPDSNPLRFWPTQASTPRPSKEPHELQFQFDVEDLYCLGSPIGLFQMLKGRTISARHLSDAAPSQSPYDLDQVGDPFASTAGTKLSPVTGLPLSVSSPKVVQLYNIFHPSDPISYRLEPLISTPMSSLKPQVLPYTKKGIFGNVAPQGLSGIGTKVGQSVSGLWTSLSAGIATNILNRSLGLSNEEVARMSNSESTPGAGVESSDAMVTASELGDRTNERKKQLADSANKDGRSSLSGHDITLIDDELETLYSAFQNSRAGAPKADEGKTGTTWMEEERRAQKVRRDELKVRALNRNGRVDYSIQEGVLDFNPINTIASHMSYWADEDVNHFILSQLLSKKSRGSTP